MASPAGIAPPIDKRRSKRLAGKAPSAVAAPNAKRSAPTRAAPKAAAAAGPEKRVRSNAWRVEEDLDQPRALVFEGPQFALLPAPQYRSRRRWGAGGTAAHPKFLNRKADTRIAESEERTWRFVKHLGAGSNGAVDLWILVDNEERDIVDRVCVKYCTTDNKNYHNQTMWEEGWTGARDRPIEAIMHQRLSEAAPAATTHILPLHAWHYDTERRTLKMYLEFAEHGNLDGIFPAGEGKKRQNKKNTKLAKWELPEAFVWWILLSLVRAALIMDRGDSSTKDDESKTKSKAKGKSKGKKKATTPEWLSLVHRDLKPENIMLGPIDAHADLGIGELNWPRLWLADFGTSMELDNGHWDNPTDYQGTAFGTLGFLAPEQFDFDRGHDDKEGIPFGSWTNVWNIGMIGYWLTRGNNNIDEDGDPEYVENEWGKVDKDNKRELGGMYANSDTDTLKYPNGCGYSKELQDFCKECVALDPEQRPALNDDLIERLRENFFNAMESKETREQAEAYDPFGNVDEEGKGIFDLKTKAGKALTEAREALDKEYGAEPMKSKRKKGKGKEPDDEEEED